MRRRKRLATIAIAAVCALAGAAAGISQSAAAKHSTTQRHSANAPAGAPPGMAGGPGGHSVHAVAEVLDKAGTAYISQTTDSGTITALDAEGTTITLKEGTGTVTYGTPTITIPSGATVTLDGKTSTLSGLAVGDQVTISSSSDGTNVFATDSSFHPSGGPGGMGGPMGGGGAPPSGQSSGSSK
jgi:ABC-type Fe3+-hydroxamate transport system substrate-binding protein